VASERTAVDQQENERHHDCDDPQTGKRRERTLPCHLVRDQAGDHVPDRFEVETDGDIRTDPEFENDLEGTPEENGKEHAASSIDDEILRGGDQRSPDRDGEEERDKDLPRLSNEEGEVGRRYDAPGEMPVSS